MANMKVFEIKYKRYKDEYVFTVLANSPERAIEDARRHLKRKYYDEPEILLIEKVLTVDVFYKTPKRKKK